MLFLKVATVFFLVLSVRAEKKIELQDIEEDNLKSEKESEVRKSDEKSQFSDTGNLSGLSQLDLLKQNILRYLSNQPTAHQAQQQRYVHQYAVTEPPEKASPIPTVQYSPHAAPQQAMVGYLSNIPMQVYLIPQYYTDLAQQQASHQSIHVNPEYQSTGEARTRTYQTGPEPVQTQSNYIEVPAFVAPTAKTYVQQYTPPVTYVSYPAQPTIPPTQAAVAPVVRFQVPVIEYTSTVVQPTSATKPYYTHPPYTETNSVEEGHRHEDSQRQYNSQTEVPYHKSHSEFPRHYNSRSPLRDDHRVIHPNAITELPHPNPILLRGAPSHLAHVPKALPLYRPYTKPVYQVGGGHSSNGSPPRPPEVYGPPYKRSRPTSLIDSYIPSSVQIEYLKRGIIKDPSAVYDALSNGRIPPLIPRHYERGFLPNQMYHTGAGGITYGHFKRTPKVDKVQQ